MGTQHLNTEQIALIETVLGLSYEDIKKLTPSEIKRLQQNHISLTTFRNAIDDFQSLVLGTTLIQKDEGWIRLKMLECLQYMPMRYRDIAIYGSDDDLTNMVSDHKRTEPFYLILLYLRATQTEQSVTEHSRINLFSYLDKPPEKVHSMFIEIIEWYRRNSEHEHK